MVSQDSIELFLIEEYLDMKEARVYSMLDIIKLFNGGRVKSSSYGSVGRSLRKLCAWDRVVRVGVDRNNRGSYKLNIPFYISRGIDMEGRVIDLIECGAEKV